MKTKMTIAGNNHIVTRQTFHFSNIRRTTV